MIAPWSVQNALTRLEEDLRRSLDRLRLDDEKVGSREHVRRHDQAEMAELSRAAAQIEPAAAEDSKRRHRGGYSRDEQALAILDVHVKRDDLCLDWEKKRWAKAVTEEYSDGPPCHEKSLSPKRAPLFTTRLAELKEEIYETAEEGGH